MPYLYLPHRFPISKPDSSWSMLNFVEDSTEMPPETPNSCCGVSIRTTQHLYSSGLSYSCLVTEEPVAILNTVLALGLPAGTEMPMRHKTSCEFHFLHTFPHSHSALSSIFWPADLQARHEAHDPAWHSPGSEFIQHNHCSNYDFHSVIINLLLIKNIVDDFLVWSHAS